MIGSGIHPEQVVLTCARDVSDLIDELLTATSVAPQFEFRVGFS